MIDLNPFILRRCQICLFGRGIYSLTYKTYCTLESLDFIALIDLIPQFQEGAVLVTDTII